MRKATKRRHRTEAKEPMMVVMHGIPDLSLTERLSVEAFAGGWFIVEFSKYQNSTRGVANE